MTHLDECYDEDGCDCAATIAGWLDERSISDARGEDVVRVEAFSEDYSRDWQEALGAEDWRSNQCTGHDQFGVRCKKRQGHGYAHDATLNGLMQFHYSPELFEALAYRNSPWISAVPR